MLNALAAMQSEEQGGYLGVQVPLIFSGTKSGTGSAQGPTVGSTVGW